MSNLGRGRCLLAATLLFSVQAFADTGSDWFDAEIHALQRRLGADTPGSSAGRARFMACGFVASSLTRPQPQERQEDGTFGQMLEQLRTYLRRIGDAP